MAPDTGPPARLDVVEPPSRLTSGEERSQRDLASTEVSPGVARTMSIVFLVMVSLVPLSQGVLEVRAGGRAQMLDLFTRKPTRASLRAFEAALGDRSELKQGVQPQVQEAIAGLLGFGNERSVLGRDGWLFYQPGIDYVTGPGFLDPDYLRVRARRMVDRESESDPHPDPRAALVALHRDLSKAGIRLVLAAIPDKAMLQPERLTSRFRPGAADEMPNNRDWPQFVSEMRAAGVDVFEIPPPPPDQRHAAYLSQDTHWTPAYMQQVAAALAAYVAPQLPAVERPQLRLQSQVVSRLGDLVDMLKLPPAQRLFRSEPVTIQRVLDAAGEPWRSRGEADVLLLGDSFTNIYSASAMGWGHSAGFAEHVSWELGRPLDVIAQNGGAASMLRSNFSRADIVARLVSKKLVVYEFAMRELLGQNWRPVPVTVPSPSPSSVPGDATALEIEGTIEQISRVPDPASAPYSSCVSMTRVRVDRVLQGTYAARELMVGFLVMQDRRLLGPARYVPGDRVRLRLLPFDQADRGIRSLQRSDDVQDFDLPSFWTVEGERH